MKTSMICLGYDDTNIYSIAPDSISTYSVQQMTTTITRSDALNSTDSFVTCFGHQSKLYVGAVDPVGNTKFLSYRVAATPQPHIDLGSPSFDIISDTQQLDATTIVSMVPTFQPTFDSAASSNGTMSSQQPCVVISANNPGQFHGLYQVCHGGGAAATSLQQLPFPFQTSTAPLLATNNAQSAIILLGYPNAKSVYVYSHLNDLSNPSTRYQIDTPIPSKGSVQVLNDAATEFLIFDYDRKITHIQLEPNINKQDNVSYKYDLTGGQQSKGIIALPNHKVFTVSDNSNGDSSGYGFEEIPLVSNTTSTLIQLSPDGSSSPSLSITIIGIIIGGSIAVVICILLLGLWLCRRHRRNTQRRTNTHEDDVRSYLNLEEDADEPSPLHNNLYADTERGGDTLETSIQHNAPTAAPKPSLRHRGTVNNSSRNTSIRRGIDTFIQRMASLRSPQSPSSIFSLFSNVSSTPPPVIDKYRKVKQVHFPVGACELMEPTFFDTNGTLIVNGHYQLLDDQDQVLLEENNRVPGYASRTIQHATKNESVRTLHYYPATQQNAFLRNINFTIRLQESSRVINHHDALALATPTRSNYQYYWISGLCMAQQSLHYLLHDQSDHPSIVDTRQFNFMSLTVLSLLSCVRDVHALDCCHLGLSLWSFYYEKVSAITDWSIARFDQAHVIGQPEGYGIVLDEYSAPELVNEATAMETTHTAATATTPCLLGQQQQQHAATTSRQYCCYKFSPRPALDCWSLGCVIYEIATGAPLFKDVDHLYRLCQSSSSSLTSHLHQAYDEVSRIHPSFRACLESLLQVNPIERSSIEVVLDDWIKANQLDDDDSD